jgi:mevalonate kinase
MAHDTLHRLPVEASAPAKIILFGEHAVVYGKPAVAVPVSSLRVHVSARLALGDSVYINFGSQQRVISLQAAPPADDPLALTVHLVLAQCSHAVAGAALTMRSDIPAASGLGSGAAVTAALARALALVWGISLDDAALNMIVYEIEKIHHGTPSGIDNTVVVYEQPIYFVRDQPIEKITIGTPLILLIGDTGCSALTKVTVAAVRELVERESFQISGVLDEIGSLVVQARQMIKVGNLGELGDLMNRNHVCLQRLSVSSSELDCLVEAARDAGALGAKLSGGGRGGNMIALVGNHVVGQAVRAALLRAGAVRVIETVVA